VVINQKGIDPVALDMFAKEVFPPAPWSPLPGAKGYTPGANAPHTLDAANIFLPSRPIDLP